MKTVKVPKNSQPVYFPMKECTVAAGFKNARYRKAYGYTHYGVDFDDRWGKSYDVLSPINGIIWGAEMNKNSIGGVLVIYGKDIYEPANGLIRDGIVRLYHNAELHVKKGQTVRAGDVLAEISGTHPTHNHIHMEIDWDIKHPYHTVQVKEDGSELLIRKGASANTMANPMNVCIIGKHQTAIVHSKAIYADKIKDAPKYREA